MVDGAGGDRRHLELISAARMQFERAVTAGMPSGSSVNAHPLNRPGERNNKPSIPGYLIERELHRGGQGIVFLATRESTGRQVAVKVLREGPFAGEAERIRFEREVNILAGLQHRNIIGIMDRGEAAGSHFLVMDYINGRPLDRFARERDLSTRDRLLLFAEVCEAVSDAHLRGVIHRDLKPGNILVTDSGEPRILDFGLAKQAGTPSVEATATQTGQILGSLPWVSPEQVRGHHAEVDIRSDVYSLGVILYQLLTDRFPYSTVGDLEQVLTAIRSAQPIRPSTLSDDLDDDLDTITLKCLAKERERRYQSVSELVRDIRYYLAGEAIDARRDSTWYLAKIMLRRHRVPVAIAAGFVFLMTISSVAMAVLYRAKAAEQVRTIDAQKKAEKAAAKADAVTDFLSSMLGSADPGREGHDVKVIEVMKRASEDAGAKFADQPDVQLAVRFALGEAYYGLGMYDEAEKEFEQGYSALKSRGGDEESDEVLKLLANLSAMYWVQGKLSEAEPLARRVVEVRLRKFGEQHADSIDPLTNLAAILNARGKPEEGVEWNRRALAAAEAVLGPEHEQTYLCRNNLAFSFDKADRLAEAEPLYRKCLEHLRSKERGDSPDALVVCQSLAGLLRRMNRLDEAETLIRHVYDVRKRILPPIHAARGDAAQMLGRILFSRNDFAGAVDRMREALAIHEKALPPNSWRTSVTRTDLGRSLSRVGQFTEAESLLTNAHHQLKNTGDHPRQLSEAAQALVDLYDAWEIAEPGTGKTEKATQWRAVLSATTARAEQ